MKPLEVQHKYAGCLPFGAFGLPLIPDDWRRAFGAYQQRATPRNGLSVRGECMSEMPTNLNPL